MGEDYDKKDEEEKVIKLCLGLGKIREFGVIFDGYGWEQCDLRAAKRLAS